MRSSQQPRGCQEAYGPRQRPFIRRSKTHLDSVPALRKKEAMIKSGAYERSQIAPPKGKGKMESQYGELVRSKKKVSSHHHVHSNTNLLYLVCLKYIGFRARCSVLRLNKRKVWNFTFFKVSTYLLR